MQFSITLASNDGIGWDPHRVLITEEQKPTYH